MKLVVFAALLATAAQADVEALALPACVTFRAAADQSIALTAACSNAYHVRHSGEAEAICGALTAATGDAVRELVKVRSAGPLGKRCEIAQGARIATLVRASDYGIAWLKFRLSGGDAPAPFAR